jgi:Tol biopolymer transport system component
VGAVKAAIAAVAVSLLLVAPAQSRSDRTEILFVGAYTRDATGPSRVLAIRPDGSGLRVIAESAASPRWSPDGSAIVHTLLRAVENGGFVPTGLAVVPADGGSPRWITTGSDYAKAWSPNGRWIAFVRFENRKQDLYVVRPDGVSLRRLRVNASWATWAPDSRRLLITTRHGLATIDLTGRVRGVPHSACAGDGAFSPNGNLIAMSKCIGRRYHTGIAVEQMDGSHFRWLVRPRGRYGAWNPAWSSDGTRIAYTLSRDVRPSYLEHTEIRMISVEGKRLGSLDSFAQDHDEHPAWSPDGTQIVFDRDAAVEPIGEADRLFVGDARTGRVRQLYEGTARGEQSWRPR